MDDQTRNGRDRWRRIAVVASSVTLALLVIKSGLGHGLSAAAPLQAARIDPGNGMALGAASDRLLRTAQTESAIEDVRQMSRRALLASPMEAAALRNLGFLTAIAEGEDKADPQLMLAGRLSKRDYFTHAWLLDRRFRQGRVVDAVVEADIVLRQRETAWPVIIPELVKLSGDPRILKPMTAALTRKPVWRSSYLNTLGEKGRDLSAVYAQLRLLRASNTPPDVNELRTYFARFDGSRNPERLWNEWIALTPDADPRSTIREGNFETLRFPPPFAWTLYPSEGVYSEQSQSPAGPGKALYISYEGERGVGFAQQSLKLTPGRYRLSGRSFGDEPVKPDQIALFIGCGSFANATVLEKLFLVPEAGQWKSFAVSFTIRPECALQQLRIIGELGDFRTRAALWIDDLTIKRIGNAPRKTQARTSASSDRPTAKTKTP